MLDAAELLGVDMIAEAERLKNSLCAVQAQAEAMSCQRSCGFCVDKVAKCSRSAWI